MILLKYWRSIIVKISEWIFPRAGSRLYFTYEGRTRTGHFTKTLHFTKHGGLSTNVRTSQKKKHFFKNMALLKIILHFFSRRITCFCEVRAFAESAPCFVKRNIFVTSAKFCVMQPI